MRLWIENLEMYLWFLFSMKWWKQRKWWCRSQNQNLLEMNLKCSRVLVQLVYKRFFLKWVNELLGWAIYKESMGWAHECAHACLGKEVKPPCPHVRIQKIQTAANILQSRQIYNLALLQTEQIANPFTLYLLFLFSFLFPNK